MLKRVQGFFIGVIVCLLVTGGIVFAANSQTLQASFNNIKIIVDGSEIHPQDAAGNPTEPFIVNGTTYLPVRAVANAVGKEVYWDGPNYTVYLGNMDGKLEYPSLRLNDATNIGRSWIDTAKGDEPTRRLTNNYGTRYAYAMTPAHGNTFEALLNMKYSRFKATVYVIQAWDGNNPAGFSIEVDGKTLYTSPEITKTSPPISVDVPVTGGNHFKIIPQGGNIYWVQFGEAGFYQ